MEWDNDIMVVEDSATQAEELRYVLEKKGSRVTLAVNGREALDALKGRPPDLIISDILMPEMDGFDLCRAVRKDPELMKIPVILLTSVTDPLDVIKALECGANNYLIKPLDEDLLISRIRQILGKKEFHWIEIPGEKAKVVFRGNEHHISTQISHVLEFLITAYEDTSHKKRELEKTNRKLKLALKECGEFEEKLIETKEHAEAASLAKTEFLAGMSHELRTPLNAIIGFSEMLKEKYFGDLNEKQDQYVRDILESGKHLLSLINDVLDLSKVEAGRMELQLKDLPVNDLLQNSLFMIKEPCLKKDIELKLTPVPEEENLLINADERKLKQVMYNLLSNALKFTPAGGRIGLKGDREGPNVVITVSDTGIGIPPEALDRIFDEFYQVESGFQEKTAGTGLGLSLVKRMVEMHGGRVSAESEGAGRGSCFRVTLPLQPVAGEEKQLNKESWFAVLQMKDDRLVRNLISVFINYAARHGRKFAVGCFHCEGKPFGAKIDMALSVLGREKRTYDLVESDREGYIYFLMPETERKCAPLSACCRLKEKIQARTGERNVTYTVVIYPDDGGTAEILLRRSRTYPGETVHDQG